MKRPLFLVWIGLISGETAAINLNRNGFFAISLLFFAGSIAVCCPLPQSRGVRAAAGRFLYRERKNIRTRAFLWAAVFFLSFLTGGILFLFAEREEAIDGRLRRTDSLTGSVRGTVDAVKKTTDGEYQLTIQDVTFEKGGQHSKKETGEIKKSDITGKTGETGESGKIALRGKCRIFQIPLSAGEIYPGDEIFCKGTLRGIDGPTNPGQFDSRIYYYSLGIRYQFLGDSVERFTERPFCIKRQAYILREKIAAVYGRILAQEEEALLCAIALGDKTDLTRQQKLLYEENGVAHLLAVSGLHVSVVGGSIFRFLRKRGAGYGMSCLCGGALLIFYGILTGFGNSVLRAVAMFGVFLLSQFAGAEYDMTSSMSLAGILMLLESPWRVLESGCIVSFLSVFAIGYILPFVQEKLKLRAAKKLTAGELPTETSWQKKFREAFTASLVISMATGPVILRFYYQWSPYSVLLNLIVIPAMNPLMISALAGGLLGLLGDFPAFVGCLPAFLILRLFNILLSLTEKIPGSLIVTGCPSIPVICLLYVLEILFSLLWYFRRGQEAAGAALLLCGLLLLRPQPDLRIVMLDVGQGDGIFLTFPSGETLLIDGGSTSRKKLADYTIIPALKYYGIDHLDYLLVTHTDEDHISGVGELLQEEYRVDHLLLPDVTENEETAADFSRLRLLAQNNRSRVLRIGEGDALRFGSVQLTCLHPDKGRADEDKNSSSVVLYLTYGTFDALFTGDINGEQEPLLCERFSRRFGRQRNGISLLKTAHHGSKNSTTEDFLKFFSPENAMISAGKNNLYGHPHPDTIKRLSEIGAKTYVTIRGGAVIAQSSGKNYEINYFKKEDAK